MVESDEKARDRDSPILNLDFKSKFCLHHENLRAYVLFQMFLDKLRGMKQDSNGADTEDLPPVGNLPCSKLMLNQTKDTDETQNYLWQIRFSNIQLDALNMKNWELNDALKCQN